MNLKNKIFPIFHNEYIIANFHQKRKRVIPQIFTPCFVHIEQKTKTNCEFEVLTDFFAFFSFKKVNHTSVFMVSEIRFFLTSTLRTRTVTTSPTASTSEGCLTNLSEICEM